jgi:hypothetical protein
MRSIDMICENCDYYEPWESDNPILIHIQNVNGINSPWSIEVNGSCRRYPPTMLPFGQTDILPGCPFFPVVCGDYWCGQGRWTDAETGKRYSWGDWDEDI